MKKIATLKKNYEFKNVIQKGKFYIGKQIIVYLVPNHIDKNVLGIAIYTKLAKAVKRNRVKRLIRENYRVINRNLKQGYNIVFLWNKKEDIANANFYKIKEDMQYIFSKNGLLEKK